MFARPLVILAICSVLLAGCGTFSDFMSGPADDHVFYRGVRLDVAAAKEGGWKTLMAADIPFSAIADTASIAVGAATTIPFFFYAAATWPPPETAHPATPSLTGPTSPTEQPAAFPTVNPPPQK